MLEKLLDKLAELNIVQATVTTTKSGWHLLMIESDFFLCQRGVPQSKINGLVSFML